MTLSAAIGILFLATAIAGPLLLGLTGLLRAQTPSAAAAAAPAPWDWRLTIRSSLFYALAFNLVFLIQELFLVIPKALTPGLRPTLFHNNHRWEGDHPLAHLFQGTGALAILLTGLACAWLIRRGTGRTDDSRLFLLWMSYHGLSQSLPQIGVGAINPGNDVGMAMDYLEMGAAAKAGAACAAIMAIVAAGLRMTRPVLALADDGRHVATMSARSRFVFRAATLPALLAIPAIVAFRVPREWIEVALPPIAVTIVGIGWIQANAWRVRDMEALQERTRDSLLKPFLLVAALLLLFQLVLRPGISFY